jgi:argininosuccinate lyase
MKKLVKSWSGRFDKPIDNLFQEFNSSLPFDRILFKEDITGSLAHVQMLFKIGILTGQEFDLITKGLISLFNKYMKEGPPTNIQLEDIHLAVESELRELIGSTAGKLHTARSRNDQIALDLHLFTRDQVFETIELLQNLATALLEQARTHYSLLMPGYTHLQRAQPITVGYHLLAYVNMFSRDISRFFDQLKRLDKLPLGVGALAGTTFNIDREMVADLLGFTGITDNGLDTVSNRDFLIEYVASSSLVMMHLSRFCEELILWSSAEFGFIELGDEFCTGSSMMPQKKNPDIPELVRGKTGRVYGCLTSLLTLLKSLPLAYNKDLQEDKELFFDSVKTLKSSLLLITKLVASTTWKKERLTKAVADDFSNATDLADYLVTLAIPFREAHEISSKIVRYALDKGSYLRDLKIEEFKSIENKIEIDIYEKLNPINVVNRRNSLGGTSPTRVKEQIESLNFYMTKSREELKELKELHKIKINIPLNYE